MVSDVMGRCVYCMLCRVYTVMAIPGSRDITPLDILDPALWNGCA